MKVGDMVAMGFDIGLIIGGGIDDFGFDVLWSKTGEVLEHYAHDLQVLHESR